MTETFKKLALPEVFAGVAAYFFSSSSFFFCVNVDILDTVGLATTDFAPTNPGRAPTVGLREIWPGFTDSAFFTPGLTELSLPGYPDNEV